MRELSELRENLKKQGWSLKEKNFDGLFFVDYVRARTLVVSWGGGWEHVSVNSMKRTPAWEEMCALKEACWKDDEWVVQYHPPKSEYVNNLEHCLHLWKPIEQYQGKLPTPDSILVGIKGLKL